MDNILEIKNDYILEYWQQQETDIQNFEEDPTKENHTKEISQKTLRNIKKYSKSSPVLINYNNQDQLVKNSYLSKIDSQVSKSPKSDIQSSVNTKDTRDTQEPGIRSFVNTNDTQEPDIRSFVSEPKVISIKQIENYLNKKVSGKIGTISSNPRYYIPSNKTKKDIKNALLFSSVIDPTSSYEIFKIQKKIQQIPAYSEGGLISYGQSEETNLGLVGEIQPEEISSTTHGIEVNPTVSNKVNSLGIISDPSVVIASQKGIETPEHSSIKTKDFNTQQIKLGDGGFIPRNEKIDLIEELKTIFLEIPPTESATLPSSPDITFSKNEPFPIEFSNIRNINSMISRLFSSTAFRSI